MAKGKSLIEAIEVLKEDGFEGDVASLYYRNGYVILRRYAEKIHPPDSPSQQLAHKANLVIAHNWSVIPKEEKPNWYGRAEEFDQVARNRKSKTEDIIYNKHKLSKMYTDYFFYKVSIFIAWSCGWKGWRWKAPTDAFFNIYSEITEYHIDRNNTIFVKVECGKIPSKYKEKVIRVWAGLLYRGMSTYRMVGIIPLLEDTESYTFSFKSIPAGMIVWGRERINFKDIDRGKVEISVDVAVSEGEEFGALASPSSNIVEITLKKRNLTEEGQDILRHVRSYRKEAMKRYRKTHPKTLRKYQQQYREKNRERLCAYNREYMRRYRKQNREKLRAYEREYYRRKKMAEGKK